MKLKDIKDCYESINKLEVAAYESMIARNRVAGRAEAVLKAKLEKEEKKKQKLLKDEAAEKAEYERLKKKFDSTS